MTAMPLRRAQAVAAPPGTVQSVQVMRAIAAMGVALYHTNLILAQPEYGGQANYGWLAGRGWLGVNFFFVLSGFIILMAHRRDVGRPVAAPRYFWRRFTRVFPIYWVFLTAYLIAAVAGIGHPDFNWHWSNLLSSYALAGSIEMPSLPLRVAWTLIYEVQFYALFAVLIFSRSAGLLVLGAWALGIVFVPEPKPVLLNLWSICFICGMIAFWGSSRLDERFGPVMSVCGLLVVLVAGWHAGEHIDTAQDETGVFLALAAGFALLLAGVVLLGRRINQVPPGWLLLLGDASYSIYLVHSAALSVVGALYARYLLGSVPFPPVFALAFVVSILAGVAAHILIEKPILYLTRRVLPLQAGRGAVPAASVGGGRP